MTRLKKELQKRNIIFEADEFRVSLGAEYDTEAQLVEITDKFLITVTYSGVVDPVLTLYDRFTLKPIGEQELYKDDTFFFPGHYNNPWHSHIYDTEETVYPWEEDEEVIEDDYASNAPCDNSGFCAGSSCKYFYQCQC